MTDAPSNIRERSPRYPFINLRKAIERIEQFYKEHDRHAVRSDSAASAWGYGVKSSGFRQTIPALIAYGMLQDSGSGPDRKLQLTELAWRFLVDERAGYREAVIKEFALAPKIMRELWSSWGAKPPGDAECRSQLRIEKGFTEGAAQELLAMYKDNIAFSKLTGSDKVEPPALEKDGGAGPLPQPSVIANIGDLVQVEIAGTMQLEKPQRLRAIQDYEGRTWAFIEGSETGIPMEQIIVEQKGASTGQSLPPPRLPLERPEDESVPRGAHKEMTSLDEGNATLIWPESISAESVIDLEHWLYGIMRKARRRAGITTPPGKLTGPSLIGGAGLPTDNGDAAEAKKE